MVRALQLILGITAGISFGVAAVHLFIGLRRGHDSTRVLFGLFGMAYSVSIATVPFLYWAASLDAYLTAARVNGIFVGATYVLLLWFVALYTGVRPRLFLLGLSVAFLVVALANTVRDTLIFGEVLGLVLVRMPWGEDLMFLEATDSVWSLVFPLVQVLAAGFIVVACVLQYRRGQRREAGMLGAGMAMLFGALVFDVLAESGAVDFVLLSDYALLPLLVLMSLQLSQQVLDVEKELSAYQGRLESRVSQRTGELDVLNRITRTLSGSEDFAEALGRVCAMVTGLFDARYAHVVTLGSEEMRLELVVGYERDGTVEAARSLGFARLDLPAVDEVLSEGKPQVVSDMRLLGVVEPVRADLEQPGVGSMMLAPMLVKGTAVGFISVSVDESSHGYTSDDLDLLETIAGNLAAALEAARLLERAQEEGAIEERTRLARELHDSVSQTLYSVVLVAAALPRLLDRDIGQARRSAGHLRQMTVGALSEMRSLLFELRPDAMDSASFPTLLKQQADALTGRVRVPVDIVINGSTESEGVADAPGDLGRAGDDWSMDSRTKLNLYRIVQEAFNNIAKHAGASRVSVTLRITESGNEILIRDDGCGFAPNHLPADRMGLRIMRERAEAISATLTVESAPGAGTAVAVKWGGRDPAGRRADRHGVLDHVGAYGVGVEEEVGAGGRGLRDGG